MKKLFFLCTLFSLLFADQVLAQDGGETSDLFKGKCGICHTIGGGRLVGPDLANVQDRRSEEWLIEFIRSSESMIKAGDPDAIAIFKEFNEVTMPDPMISDMEIKSILSHIADNSGKEAGAAPQVSIIEDASKDDIENGKKLFEGMVRFENGGPSCLSCHNGLSSTFFAENSYSSKDISESFLNLKEVGVKAILENPPFPVMAKAFEGHELNEKEVHDLLAFIKNTNTPKTKPSTGYLLSGVLGALSLLVLFGGLWYGRKKYSVNKDIYKRQIKSHN